MNSKKNIILCVPSGRQVDFSFFKSYTQTIGPMMLKYNVATITVASPMIFENRNEIVRRALKLEEQIPGFLIDYMLWIDNDIVFDFAQVQKLINLLTENDFVSGTYFNPVGDSIKPVAYFANKERYRWLEETELNGIMEVDAVGFGFCAFKMDLMRRLFEKFKPRPFDLRKLDDGSLVTEDQVLCERLKELGVKIILDSDLIVKHAKGYLPR